MTVQTLEVTTETMKVENTNFKITTFEQTTTAFCDCCPNQQTGTENGLQRAGWHLGRNEQFCPECNF